MAKIAKMMTRAVVVGKLESYEYKEEPFKIGRGVIDIGNSTKVRFTVFNKDKEGVMNPHTHADDLQNFPIGGLIYITGQDNRSYSEEKDTFYEDVSVWDYREASKDEIWKWVFVYVADIVELEDERIVLSHTNYKDVSTLFPIIINGKTKVPHGLEIGDRVKIKGTIVNGRIEDFYGDGTFASLRTAAEIKVENTKAEIDEENGGDGEKKDEGGLW